MLDIGGTSGVGTTGGSSCASTFASGPKSISVLFSCSEDSVPFKIESGHSTSTISNLSAKSLITFCASSSLPSNSDKLCSNPSESCAAT